MSIELTNQDLIDIIEDSVPDDRREVVRKVLRENPDLARRLKALHDDRDALRTLGAASAREGAPAGLAQAAIEAARSGQSLRLVHDGDASRDGRARHRRPALTRSRWPVAVAALFVFGVLGGVSYYIIQTTSPEARKARRHAEIELKTDIRLSAGDDPSRDAEPAIHDGNASLEDEAARERALNRQFDAMAKARQKNTPSIAEDTGTIDLPDDLDLGLDRLLAEGVDVDAALDASGIAVPDLGLALLEGRVVVTSRGASVERVLIAAAGLDGTDSAEGAAVAVRGLNGLVIEGDRIDLAKPAPTPSDTDPDTPAPAGPRGEVEVVFGSPSDRAVGGAYAEFKGLLSAIARVSGQLEIEIDPDAPARRLASPLDADAAVWWERSSEAWVVAVPASFRLVVEPTSSDADRGE